MENSLAHGTDVAGEHKQNVNNAKHCYEHTLTNTELQSRGFHTQWSVIPLSPLYYYY